jgi:hypothetical protein
MAITVKHKFVSAIPDAGDPTIVQPSNWNDDHDLVGTIPVANGGTGASTANGGFNALAPSQTGNSGKYLTTDGTDTSWSVNPLGTVTSVATGTGLTGGPITTSGTISIDSTVATLTGTQTLTNKTLTSPKVNEILDANGNEVLGLLSTASATDYVAIKNGIGVGVPLHISSEGSSTNIGLHIQPKGSGLVTISDGTDFNKGIRFRSSSSAASAITLLDAVATAGRVVTLPDATTTLVGRDTTDTLTNKSISGSTNTLSNIGNASLVNSAITINGTSTSLGGSINVGSVTSVGLTAPAMFTVSGSPVTGTGTLALTYSGTALPVANGGTGRTVGNYSIYANEIHVGKDGNDTTGDGTLINPVLTITQALTLVGAGRNTVIVHPGSYSESPTVSSANTTIATAELTGANTQISGTLTLSAAARVSGIKISNLTITGSGNIYISNCTVDTQVIKSGTNYVEIINSELQCVSGIQITGAGIVSIVGNKCWAVAVSNASANVLIKDCFQVLTPSVTAGNLQIDGSAIFASSPASNAVTSSVGSFITLANSFVLNSAGTNVERVSLAGFYSILNLVYDKTNSTFTGTNLNAIDYFSVINADTLVLTNDLAIAYGGTNSSATPTAGAVPYGTGTAYAFSAAGTAGQVLTSQGAGTPTWTTPTTGTVTSVTGTAPVVSSGGATPAISMPAATTSVSGYLTSTDWTTFNNKSNTSGTVTSITAGTGLTGGTITSSGTIAIDSTVVVTTGSYANPSFITSLDGSKITGSIDGGTF